MLTGLNEVQRSEIPVELLVMCRGLSMKYLLAFWIWLFTGCYPHVWGKNSLKAARRFRCKINKRRDSYYE
jgi:hypothetical protein